MTKITCPRYPNKVCPLCTAESGEDCPLMASLDIQAPGIGAVSGTCDPDDKECEACQ